MSQEKPHAIFGISIDGRSQDELERAIADALVGESFIRVSTINPEFLVRARRDDIFMKNLLSADIRVADGSGVVLAGLLSGCGLSRYPGADLMRFILSEAERKGVAVFLATRDDGLSSYDDVRKTLLTRYPDLVVGGADMDPTSESVPDAVRESAVVLCNFGAPAQEYFLESLRGNPGSVRLAVGVGGAFDFMTGRRKRAPERMRALGLEWLFRLLVQPGRIGRIWTATVVFPFLRLSDRMKSDRNQER
ncbi:MAG: WecB/TagA/CpsF family glycosyltransferase [Candidatus Moranbacteria bacterium]|nr:WecB/TagA/CpsF family glycosyltransferase [Candidatus Moranbacteria bacterium]